MTFGGFWPRKSPRCLANLQNDAPVLLLVPVPPDSCYHVENIMWWPNSEGLWRCVGLKEGARNPRLSPQPTSEFFLIVFSRRWLADF
jgi:hypothetical protein